MFELVTEQVSILLLTAARRVVWALAFGASNCRTKAHGVPFCLTGGANDSQQLRARLDHVLPFAERAKGFEGTVYVLQFWTGTEEMP